MIELTEGQLREMANPVGGPPHLVNPQTKETFVLLPIEEYERLKAVRSGDGASTQDDLQAAAAAPRLPRRLGTLKGSVVSIAPDFDDVPPGFEDYLP